MNKDQVINIAIVDDHSLLRRGIASLIEAEDEGKQFNVLFEAGNGREMIEKILDGKIPDIVILDITMPRMNGLETAQWLKENYPSIKVLVMTVMDVDTVIISMLKRGVKGYLLKDARITEVFNALTTVSKGHYYYSDLVAETMVKAISDSHFDKDNQYATKNDKTITLSDKETQFLKLVCAEITYQEIAKEMGLTPRTIDAYRENLFKKLNVQSRVGLVVYAIRAGLHELH